MGKQLIRVLILCELKTNFFALVYLHQASFPPLYEVLFIADLSSHFCSAQHASPEHNYVDKGMLSLEC